MTTPPRIRPAEAGDAPDMAAVFAAAIETGARDSYGPRERAAWAGRGTPERFADMLADPEHVLLVAEAAGAVVGVAGLRGCELSLLYAAPAAPAGTGTRLLAAVEELALRSGLAGLTLSASRNAVPFYIRRGYAIVRLASRPLPGGVSLPVCLMAKTLCAA